MASNKKPDGYWTKDTVLAEARKHKSRAEWRKAGGGSMYAATKNGWMTEATAHMPLLVVHGKWTKDKVLAEAKRFEYQARWIKESPNSFSAAKTKGWLKEACAHMISPKRAMGYWTKEHLIKDALNYQTKVEWKKANASAYATALQKGCFEECTQHMQSDRKPDGYWTKERCIESAKQYSTIAAWSQAENGAYDAAKGKSWYGEAIRHMVKIISHGEHTIYSFLLKHNIKFEYQKRFKDLKHKSYLPYDFYLNDFHLVIEYQGRQHLSTSKSSMYRKDLEQIQKRDAIKMNYALHNKLYYLAIDVQKTSEIEKVITNKLSEISLLENRDLVLEKRELTNEEKELLSSLGLWTKTAVLAEAKKYQSIRDWQKYSNSSCQVAYKNGWIEEAARHMVMLRKPNGYWTKNRVMEDAQRFSTKMEWRKCSQSAYATAHAKGWLCEATQHMKTAKEK